MAPELNDIEEAFARLTVLEFALEVLYANFLAGTRTDVSDEFKRDLVERSKKAYGVLAVEPEAPGRPSALDRQPTLVF